MAFAVFYMTLVSAKGITFHVLAFSGQMCYIDILKDVIRNMSVYIVQAAPVCGWHVVCRR